MIKHIVVWKLKEYAAGKSKPENALMLKNELEQLPSKISQIRSFEIGIGTGRGPDMYDLALVSEFANRQDLEAYQNHAEHQRVADILRSVRDSRIVVDYEL
jgi:hypothetical protein